MPVVWTIGHSTRAAAEFLALLREHDVQRLVDVRSRPRSRRHPQFDESAMRDWVTAAGLEYVHQAGLGGMRAARPDSRQFGVPEGGFRGYADYMQTAAFETALIRMLEIVARARTALMCAEADPLQCHRSMLSDALVARGVDVVHILRPGESRPHALALSAAVVGGRVSYPGPPSLFDALE